MTQDRHIYIGGAIKALGNNRYGGYLVRFYPEGQVDLHGEWFSKATDFMLDEHPIVGKPVLFHHGVDEKIGARKIGTFDKASIDDDGVWAEWEADIRDERKQYVKRVLGMIDDGLLDYSSGALPGAVRVDQTGHIKMWPFAEGSATHTPADWRSVANGNDGTRIQTLKSLTELTPREATPIEESDEPAQTGDVEQRTKSVSKTDTSLGEDRMGNLRTRLKEMMGGMVDSIIEEIVGEFAGEIPPEDVAAVADEVLIAADEAGVDLAPLEDPNAVAMMDEEEYKADTPEDEEKAKSVRKAARFVADTAIKSVNTRIEKRRQGVGKFAKSAIEAAKAQPGKSVRDTAGGFNMKPNGNATSGNGNISVGENRKYAHLSASQMMVGYMMLQAGKNPNKANLPMTAVANEEYIRTMTHKAQKQIVNKSYTKASNNEYLDDLMNRDELAIKAAFPFKANELDASDIATQGDEWVGHLVGSTLWEKARNNRIYEMILSKGVMQFDLGQGEEYADVPLEDADPIAYVAGQAHSLDSTGRPETTANINPFKTGNKRVTPNMIKIATSYTVEFEEDSVIALAPQVERQLNEKAQETIEQSLILGDTETTANTNINLIDGTPATGLFRPYYLAVDGALKLALVTAPAASVTSARSAGGALAVTDYDETLALFPDEIQSRPDNICFVVDTTTARKTRRLPELLTPGVAQEGATLFTARLTELFDVDVLTSGFMGKANNAGKVSATAGNNTFGRILALYAPYWAFVWKRNIALESARDIVSGTSIYVLSMRFAFQARGNTAATVTYNVGL